MKKIINPIKIFCKSCGKEYYVIPSKSHLAKYCSRDCYYQNLKSKKIKRLCKNCGKEFEIMKCNGNDKKRFKYCSKECFCKDKSKKLTELICKQCGKNLEIVLKKKRRIFCSKECSDLNKKGKSTWNKGLKFKEELYPNYGMRGKRHSEESKEKDRISKNKYYKEHPNCHPMLGEHHTEEARKRMSEVHKGKKLPPFTEEHKLKMGLANKGKHPSEEARKKRSASMQGIPLKKWKGFKKYELYGEEFNLQLKNQIRRRDNQICMNCGIHREKLKESLTIHHVNYDKKCNLSQNLISLCRVCHSLTNYNRDYWTKLFQEKLSKLYNYQYSKDGEIILNLEKKENE